jgi:folate receptor
MITACQRATLNFFLYISSTDTCLRGDKHIEKPVPEPEDESYQACFQWNDNACCTPEFTIQLANSNVSNIDGFHWSRCGDLSSQCRQFFIEIECFYRCSPNVAHFANEQFASAFSNLPMCGDYCDRWYTACKDDYTCVTNWITDWVYINGSNHCPERSQCRPYSVVYGSGRGICNTLWGSSFFYSQSNSTDSDETRECLVPYFNINSTNPNNVVINRFFMNGNSNQLMASTLMLILFTSIMMLIV